MEEAGGEPLLQPGDRLADRRRRNAEAPPGVNEAAGLRDLDEYFQSSEAVQAATPLRIFLSLEIGILPPFCP
jgi:hypothetical protein